MRLLREAAQDKHRMQCNHLETTINGVRHSIAPVELRRSRLRHDHAIESGDAGGWWGAAKQTQYHRDNSVAGGGGLRAVRNRPRVAPPSTSTCDRMQSNNRTCRHKAATRPPRRQLALAARTIAALVSVGVLLGGCFGETFQRGYIVPDGALEQIPIGSSQEQVLIVLGTPSTVATVSGEAFYYISQRAERPIAFMTPSLVDQRVIAVYFDRGRKVERLANYGLKDGKVFDYISRTTPTTGKEVNYINAMFKIAF